MKKIQFMLVALLLCCGLFAQVTEADLAGRWNMKRMVVNGAVSDVETGEFISENGTRTPLSERDIDKLKQMYMAFSSGFVVEVGEANKKDTGTYSLAENEGLQYIIMNTGKLKPMRMQIGIENGLLKLTLPGKGAEAAIYFSKSE